VSEEGSCRWTYCEDVCRLWEWEELTRWPQRRGIASLGDRDLAEGHGLVYLIGDGFDASAKSLLWMPVCAQCGSEFRREEVLKRMKCGGGRKKKKDSRRMGGVD